MDTIASLIALAIWLSLIGAIIFGIAGVVTCFKRWLEHREFCREFKRLDLIRRELNRAGLRKE